MANPHAPKLPTALIEQQAYGRPIYLPSVVTALIEGDVDLVRFQRRNEEPYGRF